MTGKIKTGSNGENLAADFLIANGYQIVARNYRYARGEIDLIAQRGDWIIFVEVKTRMSAAYGEPEEFVNEFKARKIFEVAEDYIFRQDWDGHVRFDVISVKVDESGEYPLEIKHFEDAITDG